MYSKITSFLSFVVVVGFAHVFIFRLGNPRADVFLEALWLELSAVDCIIEFSLLRLFSKSEIDGLRCSSKLRYKTGLDLKNSVLSASSYYFTFTWKMPALSRNAWICFSSSVAFSDSGGGSFIYAA